MPKDRSAEYAYRKEQRLQRRKDGVCTRCGVPLTDKEKSRGYLTCDICRKRWTLMYYPTSERALKRRPMQDRGKNGDCWQCGKLLPEGYTKKKCQQCIEKARNAFLNSKKKEAEDEE